MLPQVQHIFPVTSYSLPGSSSGTKNSFKCDGTGKSMYLPPFYALFISAISSISFTVTCTHAWRKPLAAAFLAEPILDHAQQ